MILHNSKGLASTLYVASFTDRINEATTMVYTLQSIMLVTHEIGRLRTLVEASKLEMNGLVLLSWAYN